MYEYSYSTILYCTRDFRPIRYSLRHRAFHFWMSCSAASDNRFSIARIGAHPSLVLMVSSFPSHLIGTSVDWTVRLTDLFESVWQALYCTASTGHTPPATRLRRARRYLPHDAVSRQNSRSLDHRKICFHHYVYPGFRAELRTVGWYRTTIVREDRASPVVSPVSSSDDHSLKSIASEAFRREIYGSWELLVPFHTQNPRPPSGRLYRIII